MDHPAPLPHEIVAEFAQRTRPPTQAQLDALARQRIGLWALAGRPGHGEHGIGFARAARIGAARFDFAETGEPAMAVIARDPWGAFADIVAWPLKHEWVASWLGRVSMLGEHDAFGPRLEQALTIHLSAFDWLRDERRGVVLVDLPRARRDLQDAGPFVAAGGVEHGDRLEALLTPAAPVILVPAEQEERRAA